MQSEHFINLDAMHEYEWTKEAEDEFRNAFHANCTRIKRCHIFTRRVFCFCTNGYSKKEIP